MRRIALVGGDEFRSGCEPIDQAILSEVTHPNPMVVILPTAAAKENPYKAASNGVAYFRSLGVNAKSLMVLAQSHSNDRLLVSNLDNADVIYFTGGDPNHLLETIANSLLESKIIQKLERGAYLVGSSAGAMVFGSLMYYKGWKKALDFLPETVVLPHHEKRNPQEVYENILSTAPSNVTGLGIDGETACVNLDGKLTVLGQGRVIQYTGHKWKVFESGKVLELNNY